MRRTTVLRGEMPELIKHLIEYRVTGGMGFNDSFEVPERTTISTQEELRLYFQLMAVRSMRRAYDAVNYLAHNCSV